MAGKARARKADPTATRVLPGDEPPDVLRGYYRQMALIRAFELRAAEMYTRAKIGGYCHLNLGEEATVVGLMDALEPRDYLFTTYREHGYALARGLEPGRVMAELFGKTTGVSGGRGGSMHLFDAQARLLGGYGIVGGQLPPATGAALALTYRGEPGPDAEAVMCLLGDGTTNIGAFHEALNLASIWKLPALFVCENNLYGEYSPLATTTPIERLADRADAYGMAKERVDGNDVLAMHAATSAAAARARAGEGPTLIEALTYRHKGHSRSDPATYRPEGELERWLERDPIVLTERALTGAGVDAARLDELRSTAERSVADALERAKGWPDPAPESRMEHVYA
jgi:pyruvate dehydrogenase E1 component alpha subunit